MDLINQKVFLTLEKVHYAGRKGKGNYLSDNRSAKKSIEEAHEQIKNKQTLSDEEASKDMDEWLNK
jgi:hypothetical protein